MADSGNYFWSTFFLVVVQKFVFLEIASVLLICSTEELDLSYNLSTDQTAEVGFQIYDV